MEKLPRNLTVLFQKYSFATIFPHINDYRQGFILTSVSSCWIIYVTGFQLRLDGGLLAKNVSNYPAE